VIDQVAQVEEVLLITGAFAQLGPQPLGYKGLGRHRYDSEQNSMDARVGMKGRVPDGSGTENTATRCWRQPAWHACLPKAGEKWDDGTFGTFS
jgi:hypothetical protein